MSKATQHIVDLEQKRRQKSRKPSLQSECPEIAVEWHPTKNEGLTPDAVSRGSEKKVWWLCRKGHAWQATICNRYVGRGCPYCAGKKAFPGETDLATQNPSLAAEWHPTKNDDLTPSDVTTGSGKKVWWLCAKGHEWQATVSSRNYGCGCPCCAGKKAFPGETDLATQNPSLAAEWHPTRNDDLTPSDVTTGSGKKVWWLCKEGHEWEAKICNRTTIGRGCPYCAKQKVIVGVNDLAFLHPELLPFWDDEGNRELRPENVSTNRKVWWNCSVCGSVYRSSAKAFLDTWEKPICPECRGRVKRSVLRMPRK